MIHQTFRPAGTFRVWERYSANGSTWNPAWKRTDAEFAAASLNVRNVGNITSGSLDTFVTMSVHTGSQQAQYSTCYAFIASSGVSNKPTGQTSTTGFFTSYLGTFTTTSNYVSRQEYRPTDSNNVYVRFRNGASWDNWVLINAPAAASPVVLTMTRTATSYINAPSAMYARFINGFLSVYIINSVIAANITSDVVLFTISNVNHAGFDEDSSFAFPVTLSNGTSRWAFLTNSGNNLLIKAGWTSTAAYPATPSPINMGFTITVPAVLK
jgi:hypothetical protein